MNPESLMREYEKALASQNWNNVSPLMHQNICVTFTDGTYKGIDEVQSVFEANFRNIESEKYTIKDLHWVEKGSDFAVCIYCFSWQGYINSKFCEGGGRGTSVLKKYDGNWQILSEHLGPHPEKY